MTKIHKEIEIDTEKYIKLLQSGDLYEFEESLHRFVLQEVYDKLANELIRQSLGDERFENKLISLAQKQCMGKLQKRETSIQLRTGTYIKVETPYARKVRKQLEGSRYPLLRFWGVIKGASPSFYSQVSKFSVLCSSFEIATQIFKGLGYQVNEDRMRTLTQSVAQKCLLQRVPAMLGASDTLAGKRVIISMDGGRIRTRQYLEGQNEAKTHHKFDTPWKEPKLLVISTIDQEGKMTKKELPIYDATFGEESLFTLLGQYLQALHIDQATEVQVVADGALWIWNHIQPLLVNLGVDPDKITETLDYYHAVQHLQKITDCLPKKQQKEKNSLFKELKNLLWDGKVDDLIDKIKTSFKRISKEVKTQIAYFDKNKNRMNYQQCRLKNWLCGSGIVESAVRRMINLRFKAPSSFWKQENLDGLIFLRCALLSGRWNNLLANINQV
jgi:hypothetical protein